MTEEIEQEYEGISKVEKDILKRAATIIANELQSGREVKIPGFGKFYTTRTTILAIAPTYDIYDYDKRDIEYLQTICRFRPFTKLKTDLKNRKKFCYITYRYPSPYDYEYQLTCTECCHPDGEGHSGHHIDPHGNIVHHHQIVNPQFMLDFNILEPDRAPDIDELPF